MGSKAGQQQETSADIAQAQHAQNLMNDYQQRWLPVQQKLASTIEQEGPANSSARRLAAGKSSTDTAIAFDKTQGALEKGMANAGVAPGSSRANLAIAGTGADAAAATGLGHMMSDQAIDDAYTSGLGALTSLGRGEKAMVGSSLSQQARNSDAEASADASASLANRAGDARLAGQVVGFGLQAGMAGSNGVSTFGSTSSTADPGAGPGQFTPNAPSLQRFPQIGVNP